MHGTLTLLLIFPGAFAFSPVCSLMKSRSSNTSFSYCTDYQSVHLLAMTYQAGKKSAVRRVGEVGEFYQVENRHSSENGLFIAESMRHNLVFGIL